MRLFTPKQNLHSDQRNRKEGLGADIKAPNRATAQGRQHLFQPEPLRSAPDRRRVDSSGRHQEKVQAAKHPLPSGQKPRRSRPSPDSIWNNQQSLEDPRECETIDSFLEFSVKIFVLGRHTEEMPGRLPGSKGENRSAARREAQKAKKRGSWQWHSRRRPWDVQARKICVGHEAVRRRELRLWKWRSAVVVWSFQ